MSGSHGIAAGALCTDDGGGTCTVCGVAMTLCDSCGRVGYHCTSCRYNDEGPTVLARAGLSLGEEDWSPTAWQVRLASGKVAYDISDRESADLAEALNRWGVTWTAIETAGDW